MPLIPESEVIRKIVVGEYSAKQALQSLVDRNSGLFVPSEGPQLDYKLKVSVEDKSSIGEISRDILGLSNTDGGLLLLGVADTHEIVGHDTMDFRAFRNAAGPYVGTRVSFDMEECSVHALGKAFRLITITVHRSLSLYPNPLRKDIELKSGFVRKPKYVKGTVFYRVKDETRAESPFGDVESRARELGFSGAAPRTRTSFLLQEDRPGLRLYAPINDRFFGREVELAELITKFDEARGRGVSIAGFGWVGKTELAIKLISELHRRGKFKVIYSGSAKQTLLGPSGAQQTDPVFIDLNSFLADLSGWLGCNPPRLSTKELAATCVSELKKFEKVLLFVDNLETVTDRELLNFLDNDLPPNCWIVATARVHKIRNFVFPKELREMEEEDAARLLRHELKRQGLARIIHEVEAAKSLLCYKHVVKTVFASQQEASA